MTSQASNHVSPLLPFLSLLLLQIICLLPHFHPTFNTCKTPQIKQPPHAFSFYLTWQQLHENGAHGPTTILISPLSTNNQQFSNTSIW